MSLLDSNMRQSPPAGTMTTRKERNMKSLFHVIRLLVLRCFMAPGLAPEVSIPDRALDAAIRQALQKFVGPLTVQDILTLTNLDASRTGVKNLDGLGAAQNLTTLELNQCGLTSLTLPAGLTSL